MARAKKECPDPRNKCQNCGEPIPGPTPAGKPRNGYEDSVYAKIDHGYCYAKWNRCAKCEAPIKTYHFTKEGNYRPGGGPGGPHDPNFRYKR